MLSSTPLRNPWIVRNRFAGRFELRDAAGARLPYPPTNYLIVGEKVKAGQGVVLRLRPAEGPPQFLRIEHHQDRAIGGVFDLAARPHPTLDIVPFFFAGGLPDARLELNVYDLLARFGLPFGPWIGDDIALPEGRADPPGGAAARAADEGAGGDGGAVAVVRPTSLRALLERPSRRRFSRVDPSASTRFLEVRRARFEELAEGGAVVAARDLEYVVPRPLGALGRSSTPETPGITAA
ncbi:hypothetical protein WMF27_44515 [Sorangium sp. So ce281]|uniref:hypothetical protein n=1 Tax=unclassified Sorangium TaxID=2621164 RepID=UPI003F5D560D